MTDQLQFIGYNPIVYEFPKFVQDPTPEGPIPTIAITYSLEFVSNDNELDFSATSNLYSISDFISIFDNEKMVIECSDDLVFVGNYTLALVGFFEFSEGSNNSTQRTEFNVTLKEPARIYEEEPEYQYFTVPD